MRGVVWRGIGGLLLCAVALGATRAGDPVDGEQGDPIPRPFLHSAHVQEYWKTDVGNSDPEVWRDCRGCHNFEAQPDVQPQDVCQRCHYRGGFPEGGALSVALPEFQLSLEPLKEEYHQAGFAHEDHLDFACGKCHSPKSLRFKGSNPGGPGDGVQLSIPVGASECARCHDAVGERSYQARDMLLSAASLDGVDWNEVQDAFSAKLDAAPEMQAESFRAFDHADHLLTPEVPFGLGVLQKALLGDGARADAMSCTTCHKGIFTADASAVAGAEFDPQACAQCHLSQGGGAVEFEAREVEEQSRAFLTFSHADHLDGTGWPNDGLATPEGYEQISKQSCHACHAWQPGEVGLPSSMRSPTFDLRPDGERQWSFRGCLDCHDVPAFRAADEHPDWGHQASGKSWDGCISCHDFGEPGPMSENRAKVSGLLRESPTRFAILSQQHPYIADSAGSTIESCRECHVAELEELPSRIQTRAFTHESHVPEYDPSDAKGSLEAVEASCLYCHERKISKTDGPEQIGYVLEAGGVLAEIAREGAWAAPAESRQKKAGGLYEAVPDAANQRALTYDGTVCRDCHFGGAGALLPEGRREPQSLEVFRFPHAEHLGPGKDWPLGSGTAMGCTTCHFDTSGGSDPLTADSGKLGTLPQALDCTLCHRHGASDELPTVAGGLELAMIDATGGASRQAVESCEMCHSGLVPAAGDAPAPTVKRLVLVAQQGSQSHPTGPEGSDCRRCHLPWSEDSIRGSQTYPLTAFVERGEVHLDEVAFVGTQGTEAMGGNFHGGEQADEGIRANDCIDCHWNRRVPGTMESPQFVVRERLLPAAEGEYGLNWQKKSSNEDPYPGRKF